MQDGFEDVFTATAMAALEWGAMPYAKGLIDAQYRHYIREDGLTNYRAEELAQQARMLTILALYYSYSGGDATFLLQHFAKAKALADWLTARRATSLCFGADDPRYGIPWGADAPITTSYSDESPSHWYASAAETYRAFTELGRVWATIGAASGRSDVAAHGAELLKLAPQLYHDLHASLNRTVNTTAKGEHCWRAAAEAGVKVPDFRAHSELMYSGALSAEQTDAIYAAASGATSCGTARYLTAGSPGTGGATIATPTAVGFAYGLLQHDMVERFLLHYFAVSAHAYTRGSFTTPEVSDLFDRDLPPAPYAAAGVVLAPIYLKWLLCFEDLESQTLWLGKAVPRDWLVPGEAPLVTQRLATRYGRIAFRVEAIKEDSGLVVKVNVTLPESFSPPTGGLRLRVRTPLAHVGKLVSVTVGARKWTSLNAVEETIHFGSDELSDSKLRKEMQRIVASFS